MDKLFDDINNNIYKNNINKIYNINQTTCFDLSFKLLNKENCSDCGIDANSLIKDNKGMFNRFYDKSEYLNNLFKIFEKILRL